MSEEEEKNRVLADFNALTTKLYDGWRETKNAIDYDAFRKLFQTSDTDDTVEAKQLAEKQNKKTTEKKERTKKGMKKRLTRTKNWVGEVLNTIKISVKLGTGGKEGTREGERRR